MALVTVQRSPSVANSPHCSLSDIEADENDDENCETECYFAGKGTACLILPLKEKPPNPMERRHSTDSNKSTNSNQSSSSDIQQHLQQMFVLLRREETLKMAVKLESQRPNRTRYLAVVSHSFMQNSGLKKARIKRDSDSKDSDCTKSSKDDDGNEINAHKKKPSLDLKDIEESCLLGIDCNDKTTIGLVLPILADTSIHLDGDGGFSVSVFGKTHIFKPVSVQAMWSALQSLHKVSQKARDNNLYPGGPSHEWVAYYESRLDSERSCLNEWNTMDAIESRRPPSPDAIRNKPTEKEEAEKVIRMKLREIMMAVDLDEVTSKYIRSRLEELLNMDLGEYKSFIDGEMLTILGQMDAPTQIFDHVYLGSEWNASNLEELLKINVRHILNVTREIDNFFPGTFDYYNVRVYDDEKTNLLKYWDNTFRYISRAKKTDSKVLVHCKMGVSRSASVVIAYAMKAYNWDFKQAINHVKGRRHCIKPNKNFLAQLETYCGMLDAMKNKEKLQRSKSDTNLKSVKDARLLPGSEPTPLIQALNQSKNTLASGKESHRKLIRRSSSSSPKNVQNAIVVKQQSQSLENLTPDRSATTEEQQRNVRHTDKNGQNYSVTQNRVLHIQKFATESGSSSTSTKASVKTIVSDLEGGDNKSKIDRKALNLHLTNQHITKDCPDIVIDESPLPVWTSSTKLIQHSEPFCNNVSLRLDQNETVGTDDEPIIQLDKTKDEKGDKMSYVQMWQANNIIEPNLSTRTALNSASSNIECSGVSFADHYEKFDKFSSRISSASNTTRVLPSRNSSLGSYDINSRRNFRLSNPAFLKGHTTSIRPDGFNKDLINTFSLERNLIKTKPKIDAFNATKDVTSREKFNKVPQRCNSEEIILGVYSKNHQPLSASAPDAYSTLTKTEKFPLVSISSSSNKIDFEKHENSSKFPNNVQNLKRNFEAKGLSKEHRKKGNSLPTSPSADGIEEMKSDSKIYKDSITTTTDLSVKGLVDKYQASGSSRFTISSSSHRTRPRSFYESRTSNKPSDIESASSTSYNPKLLNNDCQKPPVRPPTATTFTRNTLTNHLSMTDSILKQNYNCSYRKMQQHGKTHPLARLNTISKQRCNTSAYNTM